MNNTKWLSALLAGTALSVASTAAMADASFLTMQRNAAGEGVTFQVLPTADMPASATSVTISGYVSSHLESFKYSGEDADVNIYTESDITIDASTMTAIGTVSVTATVNLESSTWTSYVGSLEFAPGATFSGGFGGLYKADAYTAAGTTSMKGYGDANTSTQFMGLDYNAGPITVGAKLYDNSFTDPNEDRIGVNAMAGFNVSDIALKGVAAFVDDTSTGSGYNADYLIGMQGNFSIDMFSAGVAVNVGEGNAVADGRDTSIGNDDKWYSYTGTAAVKPVEGWTFAASYGFERNKTDENEATSYTISAKWSPVPQYDVVLAYNNQSKENDYSGNYRDVDLYGVGVWWKF